MAMTFDLVRIGWPNTVAILALAVMPIMALTVVHERRPVAAQMEAAAICRTQTECPVIAAIAVPDTALE
jgi:hypothetical protein